MPKGNNKDLKKTVDKCPNLKQITSFCRNISVGWCDLYVFSTQYLDGLRSLEITPARPATLSLVTRDRFGVGPVTTDILKQMRREQVLLKLLKQQKQVTWIQRHMKYSFKTCLQHCGFAWNWVKPTFKIWKF